MSPWDILGWMIVVSIVGPISIALIVYTQEFLSVRIRHYRTYRIAPEAGQLWAHGSRNRVTVDRITENGRVVIKTGNASWSDSPEDWKRRASRGDFYLLRGPK